MLRQIIIEARNRRQELPVELAAYEMEVLHGGTVGHQEAGPKRKDKMLRNMMVAFVAAAVIDRFGLDLAGRSSRRRSASQIVAEALAAEVRINMSAKRVEDVCRDFWAAAPFAPGWASTL